MQARILLAVGGTGGHVFPAIALSNALSKLHSCETLFIGGQLSKNPFFEHDRLPFREINCGKNSNSFFSLFRSFLLIVRGIQDSLRVINEFKPDAILGFGSYYTFPVLIASKLTRTPLFLHEANSVPGKVNRLFAPFAEKIFVHFPFTKDLFKGNAEISEMPLRANYKKDILSKEEAKKAFDLDPYLPTILVFGGSQGAKKINELLSSVVAHLKLLIPPFQILHFTGNLEAAENLKEIYTNENIRSYVKPFEKRMDIAWAAADFAITRAGASSIAEQIEYEVPGILIPYPYATDNHQEKNADFLEASGLCVKLLENEINRFSLSEKIREIYQESHDKAKKFEEFKKKYYKNSLAKELVQWIQTHKYK